MMRSIRTLIPLCTVCAVLCDELRIECQVGHPATIRALTYLLSLGISVMAVTACSATLSLFLGEGSPS
jgi:hypothetical protein